MNEKRYLLEILQQADEEMIYQAGQPWKKHSRSRAFPRHTGAWAACALLTVTAAMGGIFHNQVAEAIEQFRTRIALLMENEKDFSSYTEILDQTQTVNGISMTLKEFMLNDNRVTAMVEARREDGQEIQPDQAMIYLGSLTIDGEWMDGMTGVNSDMGDGQYLLEENYEDGTIPEEVSAVELVVQYGERSTEEEGMWESGATFTFKFKTSRRDLTQQMKRIPLDFDLEMSDGLKFHFEELEVSNSVSRVRAVCSGDPRTYDKNDRGEVYDSLEYVLYIEDERGNAMSYDALSYDETTGEIFFDSCYGTPPDADSASLDVELYRRMGIPVDTLDDLGAEDLETEDLPWEEVGQALILKDDAAEAHVELKQQQ